MYFIPRLFFRSTLNEKPENISRSPTHIHRRLFWTFPTDLWKWIWFRHEKLFKKKMKHCENTFLFSIDVKTNIRSIKSENQKMISIMKTGQQSKCFLINFVLKQKLFLFLDFLIKLMYKTLFFEWKAINFYIEVRCLTNWFEKISSEKSASLWYLLQHTRNRFEMTDKNDHRKSQTPNFYLIIISLEIRMNEMNFWCLTIIDKTNKKFKKLFGKTHKITFWSSIGQSILFF